MKTNIRIVIVRVTYIELTISEKELEWNESIKINDDLNPFCFNHNLLYSFNLMFTNL